MWMVVGLGNPGEAYARTRHNIGFDAVSRLGRRWDFDPTTRSQHGAHMTTCTVAGQRCLAAMPQGYMNRSGLPVSELAGYYRVAPQQIIVIHDDLDLPRGAVRCKLGGGHGGHNGLRDLHRHLGSDYLRVRVGIGRPPEGVAAADYVLGHWDAAAMPPIDDIIDRACDAVELTLREGAVAAMNRFNVREVRTDQAPSSPVVVSQSTELAAGQLGLLEP